MSSSFDFSEFLSKPDGDYPTGNKRQSWMHDGHIIYEEVDEIMVIKNHQLIGFRNPDGKLIHVPVEPDEDLNPPPFPDLPPFED